MSRPLSPLSYGPRVPVYGCSPDELVEGQTAGAAWQQSRLDSVLMGRVPLAAVANGIRREYTPATLNRGIGNV